MERRYGDPHWAFCATQNSMKLHRFLSFVVPALLVVSGFEVTAQDRRWLSYEPEVVEIEGRLIVQWKYGPPNFGENPKTDSKVRVPFLILSKPVSVHADPRDAVNAEVKDVTRIQLILFDAPHKQFIGKKVLVKG